MKSRKEYLTGRRRKEIRIWFELLKISLLSGSFFKFSASFQDENICRIEMKLLDDSSSPSSGMIVYQYDDDIEIYDAIFINSDDKEHTSKVSKDTA